MILDIHTHAAAPQPLGIISVAPNLLPPNPSAQLYSVGIHPWLIAEATPQLWQTLEDVAARPDVAAIGETGIDLSRPIPLFKQIQVFKRHIDLSEQLGKPLIIHDVKAHDIIIGLRRDLAATQPWIIHGFRAKPTVAQMLLRAGCMISFGEKFNAEALAVVPPDMLLAETDESPLPIDQTIASLNAAAGTDLTPIIAANAARILHPATLI